MKAPYMYILIFKTLEKNQIDLITNTFNDFDWSKGFDVEEIVVNQIIGDKLVVQFVSNKQFFIEDKKSKTFKFHDENIQSVLTGKGQFYGTLFAAGISEIESYFGFLGEASNERQKEKEKIYRIKISKYSELIEEIVTLEELLNN